MRVWIFYFVLAALCMVGCSDNRTPNNSGTASEQVNLDSLEREAMAAYFSDPKSSIPLFELILRLKEPESLSKADTYWNLSNLYDEHAGVYNFALAYSDSAVVIWKAHGQDEQVANIQKYQGYLLGKLGEYKQAHKSLDEALIWYKKNENPDGIAVTHFDRARVFFEQGALIQSELHLDSSEFHWQTVDEPVRLFNCNILRIQLALDQNDQVRAQEIHAINDSLVSSGTIPSMLWPRHVTMEQSLN